MLTSASAIDAALGNQNALALRIGGRGLGVRVPGAGLRVPGAGCRVLDARGRS
jgi:hypothetical protein